MENASEMSGPRTFTIFVNPLLFLEADPVYAAHTGASLTAEATVNFMCTPGLDTSLNALAARYHEITADETRLFAVPAEDRILAKLIWPLRHAKSCYMAGNYLGTISLCGMVAEMIAILLFDISEVTLNTKPFDEKTQLLLLGRKFEKLGQERRVHTLLALGLITPATYAHFTVIRTIRTKYLHLWSQDHKTLPADANKAFKSTVPLVDSVIGHDIREGTIYISPRFAKYLERSGVYEETETDSQG